MKEIHGFTLVKEEKLSEVGGTAKLFKHIKTGAELISVTNSDTNKCFGVNFKTPPKNSTGIAHILEHSVLCGSQKFPTKEPFVQLLKSSLQTFLNAMTYPDKTCYPVASTNTQDLYNLMDVYMDAVFFPRVRTNEGKDILAQEGWHIDTSSGKWQFKGVVYNEMKGVYSSPDSILGEVSQQSMFPDTLYSLDSGGNPENITDLTYEEFEEFHKLYYHPTNAKFFFWGDDDENKRLEKVNAVISQFDKIAPRPSIPLQKPFSQAKKIEVAFEISEDTKDARGHAAVNWLLPTTYDTEKNYLFSILDHILTALPGSPLRKAVTDSGLGESFIGYLEESIQQMYYSVGLRSIQSGKEDEMEKLILDTFADLVENGIPEKAIEAAVNSLEFSLRDGGPGHFPRGLAYMTDCLTYWLYDHDPFISMAWEKPLAHLKEKIKNEKGVFEALIKEYFLDNQHRVLVNLIPDAKLAAKKLAEEESRVQAIYNSMNDEQRANVQAESERLQVAQAKEDSPEAIASIPVLTLNDLAKENEILPIEKENAEIPVYTHNLDTTGILHSRLIFSLESLPYELLPLLSLYSRTLTEVGTKNFSFIDLGLEIEASTGGIFARQLFQEKVDNSDTLSHFVVSGKVTKDKIEKLVRLFDEIIFSPNFDNKERFMQMVFEEKARLEARLVPSGNNFVFSQLEARHSTIGAMSEYTSGIMYLEYIRELAQNIENNWSQVFENLNTIHNHIFSKNNLLVDFIANADLLSQAKKIFSTFLSKFNNLHEKKAKADWNIKLLSGNEAFVVPARVNYVGMGTNLHEHGYKFSGSALVITKFLRTGYLWDRVRVIGGAYGCAARYSRSTGNFAFVSYRDPQVSKTLDVYSKTPEFLGNLKLNERDLSCAIISTIGDMDSYMLPSAKGSTALWRELSGDTNEIRQKIREEIMATTLDDFHNFAIPLEKALKNAQCVALGGVDTEEYAKTNNWNIKKIM